MRRLLRTSAPIGRGAVSSSEHCGMKSADRVGQNADPEASKTGPRKSRFGHPAHLRLSPTPRGLLLRCQNVVGGVLSFRLVHHRPPKTPDVSAKTEEMMLRLEGDKRLKTLFGGGATPSTTESNSPTSGSVLSHHKPQRQSPPSSRDC